MMPAQEISASTLQEVLRHYPSLGELRGISRNGMSRNHSTCLLETRKGRYFAKGYELRGSDRNALQGEHAIIRYLGATGFPTPVLHGNASNETLTWIDEKPFALFDVARGEDRYGNAPVFAPYFSHPEALSAGEHLARLHLALGSMPNVRPRPFIGLTAQFRLTEAVAISEGFEALLTQAPSLRTYLEGRPEISWLLERMERYQERLLPAWSQCPRGPIHGDFIKRNLFWKGKEVASVLDFDLWNEGAWIYDLALALLPCGFNWSELLKGSGGVNFGDLFACLQGYQQVRPLENAERAVLPLLMESARCEFYLGAIAASLARGDSRQADQFWKLLLGVFRWFEAHEDWKRGFWA